MRHLLSLIWIFTALALSGCSFTNPVAWWKSVNHKAERLASLEARFTALEKEHEKLKREYFELEHAHADLRARLESREKAQVNLAETGSPLGRTPASIHYQVPKGLKPEEMKALAYEHFREQRFGEAALTFEKLLTSPEAASLQDADAMYTAGVAWFQLGNLKKAAENLEAARSHATGEQKEKVRKKVDLWLRVIDHKRADEAKVGKAGESEPAPKRVAKED